MTEVAKKWIREQARFRGIFEAETDKDNRFDRYIPLTSCIQCDESREFVNQALDVNCDGRQTEKFEEELAKYMGFRHAVAVSSGEAARRIVLRLAAEKLYGSSAGIMTPDGLGDRGSLCGKRVFCSDLTTADMVNPIVFEGGESLSPRVTSRRQVDRLHGCAIQEFERMYGDEYLENEEALKMS